MAEPLFTIEDVGESSLPDTSKSVRATRTERVYEPLGNAVRPTRLSIALSEDGTLDMSKLRGDTRERLKTALSSPEAQSVVLGKQAEPLFSDSDVKSLLTGVSQIEQLIAKLLMRIPADIAAESFEFTDTDLAMLTPPMQGVLSRYSPAFLNNNKDAIALALIYTGITRRQFEQAMAATSERNKRNMMEPVHTAVEKPQ